MSDKKISHTLQQYQTVDIPKNVLDNVLYGEDNDSDNVLKNITDELTKTFSKLETKEVKLTK
jgi:hypothetical protein